MKKRKISWVAATVCFLLLLFGVTVSMLAAFRSSVRQVSRQEELEAERFGSYYALISEDDDTLLWNSVYEGAKAEGEENWDACVEFFGGRLVSERTTGEKLRMAIDAGVRVHTDMKAAFAMYPTSIGELFAVADAGLLMPPKSTWFEPKLRSGLFIHSLKDTLF